MNHGPMLWTPKFTGENQLTLDKTTQFLSLFKILEDINLENKKSLFISTVQSQTNAEMF